MKAVAIIEMPEDCENCPFVNPNNFCDLLDDYAFPNEWVEDAPYYSLKEKGACPLKPLPKKKLVLEHIIDGNRVNDSEVAEAHGYNKCLEDITNEP